MMHDDELDALRAEIESIDRRLVELIARRVVVARRIGERKRVVGKMLLDPAREAEVVRRAGELARTRGLPAESIRSVFWTLVALSREAQLPESK